MHATRSITAIPSASWNSYRRRRSFGSRRARSITSSNGAYENPPSFVRLGPDHDLDPSPLGTGWTAANSC
jgi:hypothetical protein